jgi:hypothetical protein
MTRKDYEAIARRLRFERETCQHWPKDMTRQEMVDHLAYALSDVLRDDNPRFNRYLFLTACKSDVFEDYNCKDPAAETVRIRR